MTSVFLGRSDNADAERAMTDPADTLIRATVEDQALDFSDGELYQATERTGFVPQQAIAFSTYMAHSDLMVSLPKSPRRI